MTSILRLWPFRSFNVYLEVPITSFRQKLFKIRRPLGLLGSSNQWFPFHHMSAIIQKCYFIMTQIQCHRRNDWRWRIRLFPPAAKEMVQPAVLFTYCNIRFLTLWKLWKMKVVSGFRPGNGDGGGRKQVWSTMCSCPPGGRVLPLHLYWLQSLYQRRYRMKLISLGM